MCFAIIFTSSNLTAAFLVIHASSYEKSNNISSLISLETTVAKLIMVGNSDSV